MRRYLTATFAVLTVLLTPAAASAAEPGVHADPGSPSGKEYALPFDQARHGGGGGSSSTNHLGGGGGANPGSAPSDPRFGQGITPARGARAPGTGSGGAQGGAQGSSSTSASGGARSVRSPSRTASHNPSLIASGGRAAHGAGSSPRSIADARAGLLTPGGSSSIGWLLGGIAAVVLLGAALALALRRRRPRTTRAS